MLFHFPSFYVSNYASRCGSSLPPHEQRLAPLRLMVLSLALGVLCCCSATSNSTSNSTTGMGGPASYMGYPLPQAPGSMGRKPCGQGPPLFGQMGQDNVGGLKSSTRKTMTMMLTSTRNWTVPLRIGGFQDQDPLVVLFVPLGPLGLWRLCFRSQGAASGILGLPLLFTGLPLILESI
jgi:hypothetical protein